MERLNQMTLKKSFFVLTVLFLITALFFSAIAILGISEIIGYYGPSFELKMDGGSEIALPITAHESPTWYHLLSFLQFILPVLFVLIGLSGANWLFYRIKLKKPLADLQTGAELIMNNNLDFSIASSAKDELGQLCNAFEAMRRELLKTSKELWRQAEERKRLNAAFSHDLRNPVTVVKGAVRLLKKGVGDETMNKEDVIHTLTLLDEYTQRIELYIDKMSSAQRLEDVHFAPKQVSWITLIQDLKDSLGILRKEKKLFVHDTIDNGQSSIFVDKHIIYNVTENLVSNAVRYAKSQINVLVTCDASNLYVTVQDDGNGYSERIINRGAEPFLRGDESVGQAGNFGMGLYICKLLCEKHGGQLVMQNMKTGGAIVTASFHIYSA